jgi:hypothetical protein
MYNDQIEEIKEQTPSMEQDSEANNDELQAKKIEEEQLITPAQEADEIDRRANLDVTITRSNTFAASDNTIYGI